jgi:hypothetical protein
MQEVKSIVSADGARRIVFCDGDNSGFCFWEEVQYTDREGVMRWIPNCWPRSHCTTLDVAIQQATAEFKWAAKF